MKLLEVRLAYNQLQNRYINTRERSEIIAVIKVLNSEGSIIEESFVSTYKSSQFKLNTEIEEVAIRLIWPSKKSETKIVKLNSADTVVEFTNNEIETEEAWAYPFLNTDKNKSSAKFPAKSLDDYQKVWLMVWRFDDGKWSRTDMKPLSQFKSSNIRQIDLQLSQKPHLLNIGGPNVPWRFISLPSSGPCRVLLTTSKSNQQDNPLKVLVTSFRQEAETLLEFLTRNSVNSARTIASCSKLAKTLFEEKFSDPIAAVVGAYYLLKVEEWDSVPIEWWENLSGNFNWIPDTALLHCIRLIRDGLKSQVEISQAIRLFKKSIDQGWPIYEMGISLLHEASLILRQIASIEDANYFAKVDTLLISNANTGASMSFFGKSPDKPSATLWVGMPNAPRRRKLLKSQSYEQIVSINQSLITNDSSTSLSELSRNMGTLAFVKEHFPKNNPRKRDSKKSKRVEWQNTSEASKSPVVLPKYENYAKQLIGPTRSFTRDAVHVSDASSTQVSFPLDHLDLNRPLASQLITSLGNSEIDSQIKKDQDWLLLNDIGN